MTFLKDLKVPFWSLGEVVPQIADATDAVFRSQSAGTLKPSYPQRSPKAASQKVSSG